MSGGDGVDNNSALPTVSPMNTIKIHVKFSGRTIPLTVPPDSSIGIVKSLLQPLTNVLIRGQKLIFKGKVLIDAMNLDQLKILDGAKIMLIASEGLHQGDGPIKKDTKPHFRLGVDTSQAQQFKSVSSSRTRLERWKITGVVALSESHLKSVPEEIWDCGSSVRVLDVSKNNIKEISTEISMLKSLTKLFLNANDLSSESISWEGLSSLKSLTILSLSQNKLVFLPSAIGSLASLQKLDIANNKISQLPVELGFLNQLQILLGRNNRINYIPPCIGNCSSLIEVDFASNLLTELPQTFGNLRSLKVLHISNNGIKSLPANIFTMCSELSTINLHGTEITNDVLRQFEGWEDFDERRRLKHQKQIDFSIGCSGGFDEGADESKQN